MEWLCGAFLKNYHKEPLYGRRVYLDIDGGRGEGGGQTLRSGLALSCITGRPVRIYDIRANRRVPGLGAQHVTVAKILQKMSGARITGAQRGSTEVRFAPGEAEDLDCAEDVGTAGSISLVLQALIPAAAASGKRLKLKISGGTDVSWSPTINYTRHVLGAAYARMGINFSLGVSGRGYYPRGGGCATLEVRKSVPRAAAFCGRVGRARMACAYSGIPAGEIEAEVKRIQGRLSEAGISTEYEISRQDAADPGASLLVYCAEGEFVAGTDALYDKKTRSFDLDVERLACAPGVDENLADMLVVPASVSGARTTFRVRKITAHLETNLYVASSITGCRYGIGRVAGGFEVIIQGVSHSGIKQGRKEQYGN